jgi:hypothetical protein
MRRFLFSLFAIVLCRFAGVFGQSSPEIWYVVPLHNAKDPTGRAVSEGIDAELSKKAMEGRLGILKKLSFEKDTCFRRYFERDSFARDAGGFLDPLSIRQRLSRLQIPDTKLLLVYDVTAKREFVTWKPPVVIVVPGRPGMAPFMMTEENPQGRVNAYDSIWCKISFIDFSDPSHSVNRTVAANKDLCDDDPLACIVETVQSIGRDANARSGRPDIRLTNSPRDQHRGKIVGGSLLTAGGVAVFILSGFMDRDVRGIGYFGGSALLCGGATFLTIGIIKQARYRRNL